MAQFGLVVAGFLALMIFVTALLRVEIDMGTFVASMLSVSILSVGFMLALALQYFFGLSMLNTTIVLGAGLLLMALGYEAMT